MLHFDPHAQPRATFHSDHDLIDLDEPSPPVVATEPSPAEAFQRLDLIHDRIQILIDALSPPQEWWSVLPCCSEPHAPVTHAPHVSPTVRHHKPLRFARLELAQWLDVDQRALTRLRTLARFEWSDTSSYRDYSVDSLRFGPKMRAGVKQAVAAAPETHAVAQELAALYGDQRRQKPAPLTDAFLERMRENPSQLVSRVARELGLNVRYCQRRWREFQNSNKSE